MDESWFDVGFLDEIYWKVNFSTTKTLDGFFWMTFNFFVQKCHHTKNPSKANFTWVVIPLNLKTMLNWALVLIRILYCADNICWSWLKKGYSSLLFRDRNFEPARLAHEPWLGSTQFFITKICKLVSLLLWHLC